MITPLAPVAYAVVGLAFAPVFPTALAWLQEVFPQRAERVAPLVIAGANLGPVASANPPSAEDARRALFSVALAALGLVADWQEVMPYLVDGLRERTGHAGA